VVFARKDIFAAAALLVLALPWIYLSDELLDPIWVLAILGLHFAAGFLVAKWRALVLPLAIVVLAIGAQSPATEGGDTPRFGFVLILELLVGLLVVAAGVAAGRSRRGQGLFLDRDPWK
jgi:hypothetical protein